MTPEQFKSRTKTLALRVIKLVDALPKSRSANVIGQQLLRSATSIAANYRAACLAQSKKDMLRNLKIVEGEADETLLWLELLADRKIVDAAKLTSLIDETDQIIRMTVASIKTLRKQAVETANGKSSIVNRQ